MTTVIITCAGDQSRWNNYFDTPKHLVTVDGEILLYRTVRQLNSRGFHPWVVVRDLSDSRYAVPGSDRFVAHLDTRKYGQDRFRSSQAIWNHHDRTIILLGDVFFTDEAMDTITAYDGYNWMLFGRWGMSSFTGCVWGEVFAQTFLPHDIKYVISASDRVVAEINKNKEPKGAGHWHLLKYLIPAEAVPQHFTEIDDFTEDFDYPEDYEKWTERYERHS